ncbi:pilus assembly protein [Ramlibacter sp.]|uniref:pilus assembly protein n=1 Tax=Ramlibacter sp. TaxID=1917967 RepID=UPI002CE3422B|nr:PilC/PilY family type IV pilus protein [Ramlibacter sp.]HWI83152.1 PilC/PilY family type IV pilus protein [Ramlibacter sp.]
MRKKMVGVLAAVLGLALQLPALAEDIDLFAAPNPVTTTLPNVLIVLDNSANWNTAFSAEKAALASVFRSLPADKFRVGLMMFTETGNDNPNPGGAYVRAALRPMSAANRGVYADMIASFDNNADKANGRALGLGIAEAYRYFSAGAVYGGIKKKRDYLGNASGNAASNAVYALPGNALASAAATTYTSPITDSCQRNFIIYIGNSTAGGNVAKDSTSETEQSGSMLTAAGGSTTQIPISPVGDSSNYSNEWARFMKSSSYSISTYTIDVAMNGGDPNNSALLRSMASEGAGKYFFINGESSTVGDDIENALNNVFSEIQSVNSVFASVSLPVSVNTQGTYLNQVYIGMFRPNAGPEPRWTGNLKQYKLGQVGSALKLLDAANAGAINNLTGFISECARSFWTPLTTDSYWLFMSWPTGTTFCLPPGGSADAYKNSNSPDGNIVEKGAQAYMLRSDVSRNMKTCGASMSGCSSLVAFDNTSASATALGAATTTERDAIVNWALGLDVQDEDVDAVRLLEKRPSAHGDVVHSRPVAVNFGTDSAPQVVVFYGANDGALRAVNGNRASAIGGVAAGAELWSFMPPEFYGRIKRIKDNVIPINYATGLLDPSAALPKPYGMDGPITAFKGASSTFIYASMRRGGRSVYAFDVTNSLTSPGSPSLKWRIGCADGSDSDCTSGFSGLGQTWSSLKAFTTAGFESGTKPLMIFGGGYDACEDYDALSAGGANHNCVSSSKGHYIYVVDADTGERIKTFDTEGTRGVIADVTLVRNDSGQVIYGYTADLGGNVYRLNFAGGRDDWTITRIASLGCAAPGTCTANRKFMFAPSVVALPEGYGIMIGSGDREKPLTYYAAAAAVPNYFFMFFDKPALATGTTTGTWPGNNTCGAALLCLDSLYPIGRTAATPTAAQLATKQGWYLALAPTEQVVTSAVTIYGVTTFSTHQPAVPGGGTCRSNLGETRVYNINYTNAGSANGTANRFEDVAGDGLPPSPVAGQVTLDNGQTVPFCIGCSKDSPLEGKLPSSMTSVIQPKSRVYWYIQK